MGTHTSPAFDITHGMPQGSPLSPILSVLYTSPLLALTGTWDHRNLTIYVNDGTIYATSATANAAATSTIHGLKLALAWLHHNGLTVDPNKTKLITFARRPQNPDLIGSNTQGVCYINPVQGPQHVANSPHIHYLGVFINWKLTWCHHVDIISSHAQSTIRRIHILSNSVQGLNLLNWKKGYNALVIPILTYRAMVWYTGISQKGLVQCLQVTQNEGLCKITGTFKTMPLDPLHNMTGVPPLSYLLPKLMHAYTLIHTILTHNWCHYWPAYINPITNLTCTSKDIGLSTYWPTDPCTARL